MNMKVLSGPSQIGRWMDLATLVAAGAALLFASVLLILFHFFSLRGALLEDVNVQAKIIAGNSVAAMLFRDAKASKETLAVLSDSPNIVAAGIFTAERKALALFRRGSVADVAASPQVLMEDGHDFGFNHLELSRRVNVDGRPIGVVVLRASLDQLYARLLSYAGLMLLIAVGSLAVAYLLVARMRKVVKRAEAHLDYLAHIDSVTGLPNRHAFNEYLAAALAKTDRFGGATGLLLLDLDNFKIVNDTLGHHSGDTLLKLVARRLLECLRSGDVVCRIGGDEFAIILDSSDGAGGANVAKKILAVLETPFDVETHEIHVTASIGISVYPDEASDLETLTRNADTAMYHAKGKGKNAYERFHLELDLRVQKRLSLEINLRKAIERGELTLYYQPKVNLRNGKLAGLEALLRWNHPEHGMIRPDEFIPVAEDSGLIVPIGRWVLRTACHQIAAWRDAGLGMVHVSVNLSARQTHDPFLMQDIIKALRDADVPASHLELEITETVLMDNVHANVDLFNRLQTEGIRLSIDDFGTGYSSMAYLKRFPIDQVKIDRTFVRDVPGDRDDEAITTAIIAMAHGLGLSVVAEGVETEEQLQFLRNAGCDIMQGFYFAKPQPAAQLEVLLRSHPPLLVPSATSH